MSFFFFFVAMIMMMIATASAPIADTRIIPGVLVMNSTNGLLTGCGSSGCGVTVSAMQRSACMR